MNMSRSQRFLNIWDFKTIKKLWLKEEYEKNLKDIAFVVKINFSNAEIVIEIFGETEIVESFDDFL